MFIIQTITQNYDQDQDRISLAARNLEGEVVLLWLTQRLANRLARTLTDWLAADLATVTAGQSDSRLHAFEQSVAQAQLKPLPPVVAAVVHLDYLITSVDLARSETGYILTFKWGEAGSARLAMMALELRQWLGILYRLFALAEWPRAAWPSWLAEEAGGNGPTSATMLQ